MAGPISEHDKATMNEIMAGKGHSFNHELLRLIAKADVENRQLLALAFPQAVQVYEDWYFRQGPYANRDWKPSYWGERRPPEIPNGN